jgi:RNA polymerase sigma-70 factor (ECF subfamily)
MVLSPTSGAAGVSADDDDVARVAAPRASLADVYTQHWAFVWRVLRAHGVRESDLEDQLQEVFLTVHRKLPEFEARGRFTTWLFAIAANAARAYRRRAHVRRERATAEPPEAPGPDAAEPVTPSDDLIARHQARAALETILDAMPDEQRVVFVFFELDGMPADEIAALVGCPVNTVHSRLRLGRKYFAGALARLRARGAW